MREILFRGKRIDNGEWCFGFLTCSWGKYAIQIYSFDKDGWILANATYEVDPTTIGQYTNKTDKDNNKIFEGEYLGDWCEDDEGNEVLGHIGIVTYYAEEGKWILADKDGKWNDWTLEDCALPENWGNLYSLGNIHDKEVE